MIDFLGRWRRLLVVSPFAASLSLLLVVSVALNVTLAARLRQEAARREPGVQSIAVGQTIPALVGEIRASAEERKPYRYEPRGAQGTLLYFSASQCRWSKQNLPLFIALAQQARGHYRIVAVDLSPDLKADEPSHLDTVPSALVIRNLDTESRKAIRVQGTPETLIVSPDGKLAQRWLGAYVDDKTKREISAYVNGSTPPSP